MIDLFSAFTEFFTLIPIVTTSVYNLTNSDWGFPFPYLSSICCLVGWLSAILNGTRWNFNIALICISLSIRDNKLLCKKYFLAVFCSGHHPIVWIGHIFFFWDLYIFWNLILYQMYGWQRFSPILWSFFLLCFFSCAKLLLFWCSICQMLINSWANGVLLRKLYTYIMLGAACILF